MPVNSETYNTRGWIWHKYVFVEEDGMPFLEHRRFVVISQTPRGLYLRDMDNRAVRFRSLTTDANPWCWPTEPTARREFEKMVQKEVAYYTGLATKRQQVYEHLLRYDWASDEGRYKEADQKKATEIALEPLVPGYYMKKNW